MAKIAILTDANQPIGTPRGLPDAAIPLIRKVLGGTTNAQTADATLDWFEHAFRFFIREQNLARRRATDNAGVESGQTTEAALFDGDWPL